MVWIDLCKIWEQSSYPSWGDLFWTWNAVHLASFMVLRKPNAGNRAFSMFSCAACADQKVWFLGNQKTGHVEVSWNRSLISKSLKWNRHGWYHFQARPHLRLNSNGQVENRFTNLFFQLLDMSRWFRKNVMDRTNYHVTKRHFLSSANLLDDPQHSKTQGVSWSCNSPRGQDHRNPQSSCIDPWLIVDPNSKLSCHALISLMI